jgi:hypothetical protein
VSESNLISPEEAARRFLRGEITYEMLKLCEAARPPDWSVLSKPIVERDEAVRQRDELRRVLEPLLDDPHFGADDWCVFCYDGDHALDCPVLRADELLGRDRPPASPEGPP